VVDKDSQLFKSVAPILPIGLLVLLLLFALVSDIRVVSAIIPHHNIADPIVKDVLSRIATHTTPQVVVLVGPDHFDRSVYTNLIDTVRAHLPTHHRHFQIKQKFLNLPELHLFDTHVPLSRDFMNGQFYFSRWGF